MTCPRFFGGSGCSQDWSPGVLVPAQAWSVSLAQPLPPLPLLDKRPPTPRAPVRTQKSARAAGRYFAVGRGDLLCSPAPVPSQPSPVATVPRGSVQVGTASPAGRDSRLPALLLQPSPACPRVIWPRGLPALLRVPLPLLVFTTSPRALPLPENQPSCQTLLWLATPCSHPQCRVPSPPVVPTAGTAGHISGPEAGRLLGVSCEHTAAGFPQREQVRPGATLCSLWALQWDCSGAAGSRALGEFLFHCVCTVLTHLITRINIFFFIFP